MPQQHDLPSARQVQVAHRFDVEDLMACVGGDFDIFREVADVFLQDLPNAMSGIHGAVATGSAAELSRQAHSLKGAVGVFGPSPALETVRQLEAAGRDAELRSAAALSAALREELDELTAAIRALAGI